MAIKKKEWFDEIPGFIFRSLTLKDTNAELVYRPDVHRHMEKKRAIPVTYNYAGSVWTKQKIEQGRKMKMRVDVP